MGLPSGAAERNKRDRAVVPIYIGDDTTDEDAFRELRTRGVGIPIVVREAAPLRSDTAAEFWLRQREVSDFLALFLHDRVLLQRAGDDDVDDDDDEQGFEEEAHAEVEEPSEAMSIAESVMLPASGTGLPGGRAVAPSRGFALGGTSPASLAGDEDKIVDMHDDSS